DIPTRCGAREATMSRGPFATFRPEADHLGSLPTDVFRLPESSQNDNILPSWRWSVKTITALAAKKLGKFLAKDFRRVFGPAQDDMAERLGSFARNTIECLAKKRCSLPQLRAHSAGHDGRT